MRSGELDGAIVLVESIDEAEEALVRYRPRLRDTGYLWLITRKRGHEGYLNQMTLVPHAKRVGLIDNKTCSIDDERSGIRFVVPRALRGNGRRTAACDAQPGLAVGARLAWRSMRSLRWSITTAGAVSAAADHSATPDVRMVGSPRQDARASPSSPTSFHAPARASSTHRLGAALDELAAPIGATWTRSPRASTCSSRSTSSVSVPSSTR